MEGNIKIIIILAHFVFLLVYALLVAMLMWHYKKYSLPKERARWIIGSFIFFASLFAIISSVLLFSLPLNEIVNQYYVEITR